MNIFIFTGGEAPSPETAKPFFEKCKPDYVIAADSGLETLDLYAEAFGEDFAPNLILGDMDSLKNLSLLEKYKNAKRELFPSDKDFTDTELALSTAREIGKTASVVLVGGNGGCLDHLISIYDSFSEDFHADVWLCVNQAVYFLAEKNRRKFLICSLKTEFQFRALQIILTIPLLRRKDLSGTVLEKKEWQVFQIEFPKKIFCIKIRLNFLQKKDLF
ncbi:hypothetical protein [Treponema succinifaciens]|uniref:hypothetical protein n=1 Tax=Treponema succinifaciens TaxID=167 RepID=UPI003FEE1D45